MKAKLVEGYNFTHLKPKTKEEMSQALKQMCSSENKGYVDLRSLEQLPEGTTFSNGGGVDLGSVDQLPEGTTFYNGGGVNLRSLEQLPKGTTFSNGGGVYLSSLKQLPKGTTFSNGGDVNLGSLKQLPEDFVYTGTNHVYLKNKKIKGPIGVRTNEDFKYLKPKSEEDFKPLLYEKVPIFMSLYDALRIEIPDLKYEFEYLYDDFSVCLFFTITYNKKYTFKLSGNSRTSYSWIKIAKQQYNSKTYFFTDVKNVTTMKELHDYIDKKIMEE